MDTQRLILAMMLALVSASLYQAWQEDYGPKTAPTSALDAGGAGGASVSAGPSSDASGSDIAGSAADVPEVPKALIGQLGSHGDSAVDAHASTASVAKRLIEVRTDNLLVQLDPVGGTIRRATLLSYPVDKAHPDHLVDLMIDQPPHFYIAQSGLLNADASVKAVLDHRLRFEAVQSRYVMQDGEDQLLVRLQAPLQDGLLLTKELVFKRGSYTVLVRQTLANNSAKDWSGFQYAKLSRTRPLKSEGSMFMPTYTGSAIHSQAEHFEKLKFDDLDDGAVQREGPDSWVALMQHHFVGAWVPPADTVWHVKAFRQKDSDRYAVQLVSSPIKVAAGQSVTVENRLYAGPKDQHRLEKLSESLPLVRDYGFLAVIAMPLFWVLDHIHDLVGNWGVAIILLTILVKLAFFPLSEASYRSMARMRMVTPKLQAIRERYSDDKQRLNQAMMDLYKTEKINPIGGCWPMLVQIPVFIALYWVLLESSEMRQAPFALWLTDLSSPDQYGVLPLIMGVTMFIQQKLNPAPPDPMQAKIMMSLPVVFTAFFFFFPAGLVLYWVVNNTLSIAQQWVITRRIEAESAKRN